MNAGSWWISDSNGDIQLRIHELAEALCNAIAAHAAARTNGSASATNAGGPT
jgi:hypothetical protein